MDAHSCAPTHVVVVLGAHTDPATVAAGCERIRTLLRRTPGAVVDCDVERLSGSAAACVDALARLQVTALRSGGRLRLQHADPALLELLDLLGFTELLPVRDPPAGASTDGPAGDRGRSP